MKNALNNEMAVEVGGYMKTLLSVSTVIALVFLGAGTASATDLDLTTTGSSGTINGALFVQLDPQATGTGLIDSFVEIGANTDTTHAYNTTVNGVLDNGSADNFNHSILLGDVPIVEIGGVRYYEFLLDVNESSGGLEELISLDTVQIFVGGTANSNVTTFTGGILDHDGTLVYDMDGAPDGDSVVRLDYSLNSGSGSGDMFLYVPVTNFGGAADTEVVTLYSAFGGLGGDYGTSDGFEEWAHRIREIPNGVPEPTSLLLLGLGLTGIGLAWRKRN